MGRPVRSAGMSAAEAAANREGVFHVLTVGGHGFRLRVSAGRPSTRPRFSGRVRGLPLACSKTRVRVHAVNTLITRDRFAQKRDKAVKLDKLYTGMFERGWGRMRWAELNVEGVGENMPEKLAAEGARP